MKLLQQFNPNQIITLTRKHYYDANNPPWPIRLRLAALIVLSIIHSLRPTRHLPSTIHYSLFTIHYLAEPLARCLAAALILHLAATLAAWIAPAYIHGATAYV